MSETTNTPETEVLTPATASATPPAPQKRSRKRTILWSGAAVLAALVLVGGGAAIGSALSDDDDDDRGELVGSVSQAPQTSHTAVQSETGASSADTVIDVIRTASAVTEGDPTSIEASRGGAWEVQFTTADGAESDVRVDADGKASVVATDRDDTVPTARLDADTVRSLVSAALAHTEGTIVHLDVEDNPGDAYEVTVLTPAGAEADLTLDASFTVTSSELDDRGDD